MNKKEAKTDKMGILSEFISTLFFLACVLFLSFLLVTFVIQRTTVVGSSMELTLHDGDNLMIDKISYRLHDPERFDIIVFPPKMDEDTLYIKRVIGLPGETIRIDEYGIIYINDVILPENYGREVILNPGIAINPIKLGDDEYFVLGDNRNNSADSRIENVGMIERKEIVGKAWVRIYPFNKIGVLKHG